MQIRQMQKTAATEELDQLRKLLGKSLVRQSWKNFTAR
jgi:hypothetical protein